VATVVIISGLARSLTLFRGPLLRRLLHLGHHVITMAPEPDPPPGLLDLGAHYRSLPLQRAGTNPLQDLRVIRSLARTFRELRPDVVLGYNVKPMVYALLAAQLAAVPRRYALVTGLGYLFLPDGSRRQRLVSAVARPLYRLALQSATAVFLQNPDDERDLRKSHLLPRRQTVVRVAGSGIDLDQFPRAPLPEGPPRYLFIGRLLRDKGVFEFVDAARQVRQRLPDATFALLGATDPNPSSVQQADLARWQAEGVVEYLGTTDDVRPHLRAATVFVLPSYREGTPRSVLEAMATGRPIVTTDAPGCRETVIDGEGGFLVPVRSSEALAQAMIRLADPALAARMGAASHQRAREVFDVRQVVQTMLAAMALDTSAGLRSDERT
jgi:glycosyltransferase involved in cell wall biosynthesis